MNELIDGYSNCVGGAEISVFETPALSTDTKPARLAIDQARELAAVNARIAELEAALQNLIKHASEVYRYGA